MKSTLLFLTLFLWGSLAGKAQSELTAHVEKCREQIELQLKLVKSLREQSVAMTKTTTVQALEFKPVDKLLSSCKKSYKRSVKLGKKLGKKLTKTEQSGKVPLNDFNEPLWKCNDYLQEAALYYKGAKKAISNGNKEDFLKELKSATERYYRYFENLKACKRALKKIDKALLNKE